MSLTVSVIIPAYNRERDVLRAVASVLAQDLAPLEVLVVDDGSTDGTAAAVAALPAPVRLIRQPNGGVSAARNRGLAEARGDLIALLDSDDEFLPGWLSSARSVFEARTDTGAVFADTEKVDEQGNLRWRSAYARLIEAGQVPVPTLFTHRLGLGSNLVVRRDLLAAVGGFDPGLATGEDIDVGLRLAARAPLRHEPSVRVRIHESSGSLSGRINTGARLVVYDKFEAEHPELARRHAGALRAARRETALGYALDLTVARDLATAQARTLESLRFGVRWPALRHLVKLVLLRLAGRDRGPWQGR